MRYDCEHILSIGAQPFTPLHLSHNDDLPHDIVLVLAYPYAIPPQRMVDSLQQGLASFPHLTGRLSQRPSDGGLSIVPCVQPVQLQYNQLNQQFVPGSITSLSNAQRIARYAPTTTTCVWSEKLDVERPMLQARLTEYTQSESSVLGLHVSHRAVDGAGLAMFLACCTAPLRQAEAPEPVHARAQPDSSNTTALSLPFGYLQAPSAADAPPFPSEQHDLRDAVYFTLPITQVTDLWHAASDRQARFALTAWLCSRLIEIEPSFQHIAIWCDSRGTAGIPRNYTGNTGCYLTLPAHPIDETNLARQLGSLATRQGLRQIEQATRSLQAAERMGQRVIWGKDPADTLQVNLVPHAPDIVDFGGGPPIFGQLLTRNCSGLRVSVTPDGRYFLVEACLPGGLGTRLASLCQALKRADETMSKPR
ncbi:MAG: acyltransferase [Planctomycetota bacterium]